MQRAKEPPWKEGKSTTTHRAPARHFLAGLGSGIISALLLQPLDLLKTRVQQQHGGASARSWIREIGSGTGHAGDKARALWRGTVPSVLRTGFGSALYFTCLEQIRHRAGGSAAASSSSSSMTNLVSGAAARVFAGLLTMPLTVIKVRFESSLYSYRSLPAAAGSIYRTRGMAGFFAGFGATALRDGPYAGLYVAFYELSKRYMRSTAAWAEARRGRGSLGTPPAAVVNFSSGILAGAACSAISNPFDAIKTRIQLQPDRYRHMYDTCRLMVSREGVGALFDGLGLRMARKAFSSAIAWTLYEELVRRTSFMTSSNSDGTGTI